MASAMAAGMPVTWPTRTRSTSTRQALAAPPSWSSAPASTGRITSTTPQPHRPKPGPAGDVAGIQAAGPWGRRDRSRRSPRSCRRKPCTDFRATALFVSAELGYAAASYGELRARTDASVIGPYEIFDFIPNADGTYSIRSVANGLYVSAELGYTGASYGELRARSAGIGAWEEFLASTAPAGCVNYGTSTITGPDSCAGTFSKHSIWFSGAPLGFRGREIWTWANGTVQDSTATYQLSGLSSRFVVEIDAFVPNFHSNARHVHYHLCAPGNGCTENYLDQSPYYDQWAVVGYVCTTDGPTTVTVADDGGDRYPKQIAADAIRGVRTTYVC